MVTISGVHCVKEFLRNGKCVVTFRTVLYFTFNKCTVILQAQVIHFSKATRNSFSPENDDDDNDDENCRTSNCSNKDEQLNRVIDSAEKAKSQETSFERNEENEDDNLKEESSR